MSVPALRIVLVTAGLLAAGASAPAAAEESESVAREALLEQVRQSELAFAATVAARDTMRFAAMIAEDAVFVGGGGATRGRDAIVQAWSRFFEPTAPEFVWRPEIVELSADGTLGFTRGPWTMKGKDAQGEPIDLAGIFNSVWRRQADGGWRVVFDAGCSPCPACPE